MRPTAATLDAIGEIVASHLVEPLVPLVLEDVPQPLGRAPDYPDAIYGWHAWLLGEDVRGPVLISPAGVWLAGRAQRGGCVALSDTAEARRLFLRLPLADGALATGRVRLFGRVDEHERGLRAEAAYPSDLVAPSAASAARLAHRYGVPAASARALASYARLM